MKKPKITEKQKQSNGPGKTCCPPINVRSMQQLGNAVRRIRRLQKLSQIVLAKKAGVTQATISRLEGGIQKAEIDTLFLILSALSSDLVITARPKTEPKNSLEGLF